MAVILHTLQLLKPRGFQDFGSITVLLNTDEEIGSFGSRTLIFHWTLGKAGAVANITLDETSLEAANIRYARRAELDGLLAALQERIMGRKKAAQIGHPHHG
nr:hypothetical protein [uncultured Rhodoferax sp.]